MDLSSTIIGLVVLGLFLLPALIITKANKKKAQRLQNIIMEEAVKNELTITESDNWNEAAIGIDMKNDKIIFIDESQRENDVRIINLKDVRSVRTSPAIQNIRNQKKEHEKESQLSLSLLFKEPSRPEIDITFYVAGFGKLTKIERGRFEKWSKILGKRFGILA